MSEGICCGAGCCCLLQVLQAVASALTHRSCKSQSHSELLGQIVAEPPCRQLYLIIHNIDGPGETRGGGGGHKGWQVGHNCNRSRAV